MYLKLRKEGVIQDASQDGYDFIESYPNKTESDMYYNFVGPFELYKKFGFEHYGETENRLVLRKKCNKRRVYYVENRRLIIQDSKENTNENTKNKYIY